MNEANAMLDSLMQENPAVKAFKKYEGLVQRLTDDEYAGLRLAVEKDRARRIQRLLVKYPFLAAQILKEESDEDY